MAAGDSFTRLAILLAEIAKMCRLTITETGGRASVGDLLLPYAILGLKRCE